MRQREAIDNQATLHIAVVGAGPRFLSGISVYTTRLANALARRHAVSAVLMRQLLPTRLYPGKARVGAALTLLDYDPAVRVFDGVDWYWFPSIFRAAAALIRQRPEVVIFQWWSGTVLHSYLALGALARLLRARVFVEFHEVLDTAEAALPAAQAYVRLTAPLMLRLAHGFVVHSASDRALVRKHYSVGDREVAVLPHGPYDHYQGQGAALPRREAPATACNLLYFGTIRPYKGLEDLIRAFDAIPEGEIDGFWLTVVGETWEGWTLPTELIAQSRYRGRITFVNRYVHDEEVAAHFAAADVVVLPYRRSSMSGPLQVALGSGLPVVVTTVGGLPEAVEGYEGAVLVPPADPERLHAGLVRAAALRGRRFAHAHSWERAVEVYGDLFAATGSRVAAPTEAPA